MLIIIVAQCLQKLKFSNENSNSLKIFKRPCLFLDSFIEIAGLVTSDYIGHCTQP